MRKIIILAISAVLAFPSFAQNRTEGEMAQIAKNKLESRNLGKNFGKAVEAKKLYTSDKLSIYGNDNGFVVVSKLKNSSPVLGYSDKPFNADRMPDGLKWWIDKTNKSMAEGNARAYVSKPSQTVTQMLTSKWGQESPFNSLCPSTGSWGSSSYTGCVATAMAQILRYHKYPAQSQGSSYYLLNNSSSQHKVNLSTTYDWDNMLDRYVWNYNDNQSKAVAELMRDCGYASHMDYTSQGSGTNAYDAGYGLVHNMKVDSLSLRVLNRAYMTDDDWMNAIYEELVSGRPILYNAVDPGNLGHAFVFDGLDADGKVHVNWGWTGDADGYFDVSALTPSYPNPYTGGQVKYNFTDEQIMITGIVPRETPTDGEQYQSCFYLQERDSMWFDDNDTLKLKVEPVYNYSALTFNGMLGIVIQDENGHGVIQPFFYTPWSDNQTIPVLGGTYTTEAYYPRATLNDADGKTPRPDGKYYIYLVSWASPEINKSNPQYIRFPMALADQFGHNYSIWEVEKKNGHWVPSSMKRSAGLVDGIDRISANPTANTAKGQSGTQVYDLNGRLLHSGNDLGTSINGKPGLYIIRQNGKTMKIVKN